MVKCYNLIVETPVADWFVENFNSFLWGLTTVLVHYRIKLYLEDFFWQNGLLIWDIGDMEVVESFL